MLMLMAVALGGELAFAALTSPLFGIDRITIRGAGQLPEKEQATTQLAVWVPPGSNLLRAPLGTMEQHLEALPWVRSAQVKWNTVHSLAVDVTQRFPVAAATVGAAQYELDEDGIPIRIARPDALASLPKIEIEQELPVRLGVPFNSEALRAAIFVYRDAPRQPMARIAKIIIDPAGNMCLNMLDGIQVKFGRPNDIQAKMKYLSRVYELEPNVGRRIVAINLSVPKQPACTLKTDVAQAPAASSTEPQPKETDGAGSEIAM
jgi:cell division septal protein FtsQ